MVLWLCTARMYAWRTWQQQNHSRFNERMVIVHRFVAASRAAIRQLANRFGPATRVKRAAVALTVSTALIVAPTAASATGEPAGGASGYLGDRAAPALDLPIESVDPRILEGELPTDAGPSTRSPYAGATAASGGGCTHKGNSDRVHWSKTTSGTISSHAWWEDESNGGCEGVQATVTVELQRYVCQYFWGIRKCDYKTITTARKRNLWPGGGSSNWVPVNYRCRGDITVTWRTRVDVDLQGRPDHWGKFIPDNSYNDLDCSTY